MLFKIFFVSTFLTSLLISGCKKDHDGLTDVTESGAHTFSCKINGDIFKPYSHGGLFSTEPLSAWVVTNSVRPYATIYTKNLESKPEKAIQLHLEEFTGPGRYEMSADHNYADVQYWFPDRYYTSVYTLEGWVNISKYDKVQRILAGTFEFRATNRDNPSDIISVTEGRFDIKFK